MDDDAHALDFDRLMASGTGDDDDSAYAGLSPRSRRKRKNRDQMRAARQREKETMERLHAMVERLETQFRKLQQQKQKQRSSGGSHTNGVKREVVATSATVPAAITPAAYAEALSVKAKFQEENFHLKQTLYEKNKLKETLERHVGDYVEPTPEERVALSETFPPRDRSDNKAAADTGSSSSSTGHPTDDEPAYAAMSESDVWAIIADVHRRMAVIKQSLATPATATDSCGSVATPGRTTITVLSAAASTESSDDEFAGNSTPQSAASSSPTASPSPSPSTADAADSTATPPPSTTLPPFLGWDVRHDRVHNNLRFSFEKSFAHISPFEAMVRMWDNERAMYSYRDVPLDAGRQTLGIVQQLNDDTYVFQRRLADASTGHRELVSTYLRYRLRTHEGFLVGSVSIDDALLALQATGHQTNDVRERVWAAKLYLWTEFVPMDNNAGCCVRMCGSVNLDTATASQRNIANLVIGLLRWENINIGPIFALTDR